MQRRRQARVRRVRTPPVLAGSVFGIDTNPRTFLVGGGPPPSNKKPGGGRCIMDSYEGNEDNLLIFVSDDTYQLLLNVLSSS